MNEVATLAAALRDDHRLLGLAGDLRRREAPDRRPPGGRPAVGRGARRRGRRGAPAAVPAPPRPGRRRRLRPAGRRTIPPQPAGRAPPRGWAGFHVGGGGHAGRGAGSLLGRPARDRAHRRAGLRAPVRPAGLRLPGRTPRAGQDLRRRDDRLQRPGNAGDARRLRPVGRRDPGRRRRRPRHEPGRHPRPISGHAGHPLRPAARRRAGAPDAGGRRPRGAMRRPGRRLLRERPPSAPTPTCSATSSTTGTTPRPAASSTISAARCRPGRDSCVVEYVLPDVGAASGDGRSASCSTCT